MEGVEGEKSEGQVARLLVGIYLKSRLITNEG